MERDDYLYHAALELLRDNETYQADAAEGAPVGNSVVGSLLAIQHNAPRQITERAVVLALATIRREAKDAAKAEAQAGERHTLPRSGEAPLTFTGELLAASDGERQAGRERNRWHELAVYKTPGGKYVVRIAYRTRWEGELDHDAAEVLNSAAEVYPALAHYYDLESLPIGYPAGPSYADRQLALMRDLRSRYDAQVSEILAADPIFAEEVP